MFSGISGLVGDIIKLGVSNRQSKIQRSWLERLSSTAHQREVDDLYKAGLNPILSAMGGHGSSTPSSSAAAEFSGEGLRDFAKRMSPLERAQVRTQDAITDKERALTIQSNAQTDLARADAVLKESQNAMNVAKMADIYSDVERKRLENRFLSVAQNYDLTKDGKELSSAGYRRYFKDARSGSVFGELLGFGAKSDDVLRYKMNEAADRVKASHENKSTDVEKRGRVLPRWLQKMGTLGIPSISGAIWR